MTQSAPSLPHDPNNPIPPPSGNFLLFNLIPSTTFKKKNLYFLIRSKHNKISTDNLIIKETFDKS